MPALNHTHILRRVKHKVRKDIYMCTNPECSFTRNREFLIGKLAQCPYCYKTYILDRIQLNNKEPHCKECKRSTIRSIKRDLKKEAKFIENLLSDKGGI